MFFSDNFLVIVSYAFEALWKFRVYFVIRVCLCVFDIRRCLSANISAKY